MLSLLVAGMCKHPGWCFRSIAFPLLPHLYFAGAGWVFDKEAQSSISSFGQVCVLDLRHLSFLVLSALAVPTPEWHRINGTPEVFQPWNSELLRARPVVDVQATSLAPLPCTRDHHGQWLCLLFWKILHTDTCTQTHIHRDRHMHFFKFERGLGIHKFP